MYENSNLIVAAWDNSLLVGVSRAITDWAWSCYLVDLAVRKDYQKSGIGKRLIDLTKKEVGTKQWCCYFEFLQEWSIIQRWLLKNRKAAL